MGGGDGAAFKRPGYGARLQRILGLGSGRAPRSLTTRGPESRRTAPPPPGHASAGPAAMSSHIAKSESKTSLLKAAAPSGGSRVPRHGPVREPGLSSRRTPGTPPPSGDPSSRRPLCRPAPREEGPRGSRRGLPQAHCRPREALPAAASRPSPSSPLPPARGRDGEERGLSPALGLRRSLRAPRHGVSAPVAASEADPFLHRLRPMLSSAFGQVRAAPPVRARWRGARDPAVAAHPQPSSCGPRPPGSCSPSPAALRPCPRSSSPVPDSAPCALSTLRASSGRNTIAEPSSTCQDNPVLEGNDLHKPPGDLQGSRRGALSRWHQTHYSGLWPRPPVSDPTEQWVWSLGVQSGDLEAHSFAWARETLAIACGGPKPWGKVRAKI